MSNIVLTKRQEQILKLVQMCATNKAIAKRLGISESTVKLHMSAILKKYGCRGRTQLAVYTTQNKSIELPDLPPGMENINPSGWVKRNNSTVIGVYWGKEPPSEDWEPVYIPRRKHGPRKD